MPGRDREDTESDASKPSSAWAATVPFLAIGFLLLLD